MSEVPLRLLQLYLQLGGGILIGLVLGRKLPAIAPQRIGQFLYWIGVPIGILAFLRHTPLTGDLWLAPLMAWVAIGLGALLAWLWMQIAPSQASRSPWQRPTQGSFLLASMVGNTGYLGYPVTLTLVGQDYFAWAIFYDLLGTTLGAYGLGVLLAARFGQDVQRSPDLFFALLKNPTLWSLAISLNLQTVPFPPLLDRALLIFAWSTISLSLLLIGMRLSHLPPLSSLKPALVSLGIKMLIVPLLIGMGLAIAGIHHPSQLVLVLQAAMPPAFATLVIAEIYDLDRHLAVAALTLGTITLAFTLPLWLWLFG